MKQLALHIFKSKYLIWPVIFFTLITSAIIVYFSNIEDIIIFPDLENYSYNYYTDESNGGNSQVVEFIVSDSIIRYDFYLKAGFQSPYVGMTISPLVNKYINARKCNQIRITVLGRNIDRIGISLYTSPISFAGDTNQDETLYHSYLNISSRKEIYTIPINQLSYPEWWEDLHHIQENQKNRPDMDKILHLNIGSAYAQDIDNKKTLEIYSIAFTRNNEKLFLVVSFVYCILILLNFGVLYLISFRKNRYAEITVSYKPLDITNKKTGEEKCIDYINNNYDKSDLSLEMIAKETGITTRRITTIIRDSYNCNFKTYLNRIRINESKRFLTQTDLSIGEIAYTVGFNNQSHFNRVFKNEMHISPSEFREQQKS
ncbi:MAG: helix-turn-helix transcriptional regulator [Bacteroidales bacterium]|nr:helix-turn-helix transcriptional regulator [Bacteroidales bacterium]